MRKKIFLTAAFIVSLIPMIANQYGTFRGVNEVSGLINLWNPIGIIAVIVFLVGVWVPFKNPKINKTLGLIGLIGVILAEIYTFLTWQNAGFNLSQSFESAFPEFYLGLITSTLMIVIYLCTLSSTSSEDAPQRVRTANRAAAKANKASAKSSAKATPSRANTSKKSSKSSRK